MSLRPTLRSALRSRLLRATGSLAVVAVFAVPAMPGASAADELGTTPGTPTQPTQSSEPAETAEPTQPTEPTESTQPQPAPETAPEPGPEAAPESAEPAPVQPAPAGPACRGGAFGTGPLGGAVNPLDGSRWVATAATPGRLLLSRDLGDGTTTPPLATVDLPGAPGVAGGMSFGTDGRLHLVAAGEAGGEAVLYRTPLPLRPGARPVVADEVSRARSDAPLTRIAFDRAGLLHLVQDGLSTAVDPVTGDPVATYDAVAGQGLACGRPGRLTVRVDLPQGRAEAADQLAVSLTGGAYDGSPTAPVAPTGVTAGTDAGVQARRGEYVQVVTRPGSTHDVTLRTVDGAEPSAYDVTLACLDDDSTSLLASDATSGTLTLPAESAAVTCTFTAVPAVEPSVVPPAAPSEPHARSLRPSVRTTSADGPLGGGIGTDRQPGGGAGKQPARDEPDSEDDAVRAPAGDLGRDLGAQMDQDGAQDGALGGGLGGAMPGMSDPGAGVQQPRTTADRGPSLPNTGGPPAVVLPLALGAIVLGAVLVARRRRVPGGRRA